MFCGKAKSPHRFTQIRRRKDDLAGELPLYIEEPFHAVLVRLRRLGGAYGRIRLYSRRGQQVGRKSLDTTSAGEKSLSVGKLISVKFGG